MFNIGDYLVYKKEVCKITDIKNKHFDSVDYYILTPVSDESLKINVPITNTNDFRSLISKEELEQIISTIPKIGLIVSDDKTIENEYKNLMSNGKHEDLIKIIKTTYLRNKERLENKKRIGEKDDEYFKLAERYLYSEFAVVLGTSYEDAKNYVIDKVDKIEI